MTPPFLQDQVDYLCFLCGLSFILLALSSHEISRQQALRRPWKYLGLFGLTHGVNEWLEMLGVSLAGSAAFEVPMLLLLACSFCFLVEFGRVGVEAPRGKRPRPWIYALLTGLVALGGLAGLTGLYISVRYTLGLLGGLWAALTLLRYRRINRLQDQSLLVAAVCMALYGVAAGAIAPEASFFPASVMNEKTFLSGSGFPIQLLRAGLAISMSIALWHHSFGSRRPALTDR